MHIGGNVYDSEVRRSTEIKNSETLDSTGDFSW